MAGVSVVTDSTAYLPADLVERYEMKVVSLYFTFGDGETARESDLADYGGFYERLRDADVSPSTSPPEVEDFVAVYEPLLAAGRSIVSVHISSGISQTCEMARRAAERLEAEGAGGERIRVLDSSATGTLGLLAMAAARSAASGAPLDEVADVVRQARLGGRVWFLLDTLEYLRRGGRIGSAAAWIGSTLNVKPILTVESEIKAVERVRTRARGLERLADFARQLQSSGSAAWAVPYAVTRDDAEQFAERLQEVFWRPPEYISEVGPVIGTHTGPGLIGVVGIPTRFLGE